MSKEEYTIGQAAQKLHTTPRTLRFYEQKKLVVPMRVDTNGYRIYSEKEIETLKVILYLRSLGFSIQKIQQLLAQENSSQSIELLISQEIVNTSDEITSLKQKQKQLLTFKAILHQRKLDKEKIYDITTIMKSNTKLVQFRKKIIYYGLGILALEIIGILGIANVLIHHQIFLGESLVVALIVVLGVFSALLSKTYYDSVAYVCPNCGTKFVPIFNQFFSLLIRHVLENYVAYIVIKSHIV